MSIEDLWHGSDRPHLRLTPGHDGGIHLGTRTQAEMRNSAFLHRVSALVDIKRITRSKDTGGEWEQKVRRSRLRGFDAIIYLNRWEGVRAESLNQELDGLSDRAFMAAVPEAEDSLIILDESSVKVREIVPGHGRMSLYHGTTHENARDILETGFTPETWRRGANGGRTGTLYLTDVPMNALWFAEQSGSDVVLEIRPRACDLFVDPEDGVQDTVIEELHSPLPAMLATRAPISPMFIKIHPKEPVRGLDLGF